MDKRSVIRFSADAVRVSARNENGLLWIAERKRQSRYHRFPGRLFKVNLLSRLHSYVIPCFHLKRDQQHNSHRRTEKLNFVQGDVVPRKLQPLLHFPQQSRVFRGGRCAGLSTERLGVRIHATQCFRWSPKMGRYLHVHPDLEFLSFSKGCHAEILDAS